MPRFGHHRILTEQQIRDVVALLWTPRRRSTSDRREAARLRLPCGRSAVAMTLDEAPRVPAGARRGCRSPACRSTRRARPTMPTASASTTRRAVRQRRAAAHHRLPCAAAADALSRAERQPRRRRCARQAAAPGRRGAAAGISASRPARATRTRSPTSISSARRARYGAMGGFAHLATLVKRLRGDRARARCCSTAATPGRARRPSLWTQGPGHGRRGEAARRRRHDRALGIHATARSA